MHPTETYIRAIRNSGKREYAEDFRTWLYGQGDEPDYHAYGISLMAAQAVEMSLRRITRGDV
jgi:hypothetical protein